RLALFPWFSATGWAFKVHCVQHAYSLPRLRTASLGHRRARIPSPRGLERDGHGCLHRKYNKSDGSTVRFVSGIDFAIPLRYPMYSLMYMYAFACIGDFFMDRTLSVTSARQQLLKLTKDVRRRMDRVVLTNKGEAAAILMSVGEYNGLKAAAELAMRPDVLKATREGFERIQRGEGIRLEDAFPPAPKGSAQTNPPAHASHRKRPAHSRSKPQRQAGD